MSPTRSRYRGLGLNIVSLEENNSHPPNKTPMGEENMDEEVGDPIKLFLEEALKRQRNEVMDIFCQILSRMITKMDAPSTNDHFIEATPFKVQVNFDIPLFEGNIDTDALEKWLSLLEGYFSVQKFSNNEKIILTLLKALPHVLTSIKSLENRNGCSSIHGPN
jgi:hypothetical protein